MIKNKEKTPKMPKQKLTTFDIVYKVITVIMALAMFPLCYFLKIVYIEISHESLLNNIAGFLSGDCDTQSTVASNTSTFESFSIYESPEKWRTLVETFMPDNPDLWSLEHLRPALIAAMFIGIALLLALAIIVAVLVTRNEKIVMALSGAGFISTIIALAVFSIAFANPIVSGEVSLVELFEIYDAMGKLLLSSIGTVSLIRLDAAFYSVMFLMLGILAWSVCAYVVNLEDREAQKIKKPAKK